MITIIIMILSSDLQPLNRYASADNYQYVVAMNCYMINSIITCPEIK